MSNSFFNNTIDLVGGTKARASDVEANFTAVATGFDGVETALNLKAPAASPTFTGVPVAPTAAPGTSSFQLATTQFVANAALTSVLPGQGGNSGKYLKTDGTNASWEALSLAWGSVTGTPTTLTGYGLTMSSARTELGATTVGNAVFTAATEAAGRTALGASTVGANVFTAATAADARTQLGGSVTGQDVFTAASAAAARTAIGAIASGGDIGAATATTAIAGDSTTKVATTAFVAGAAVARATNLTGSTVGSIPYQSAANTTTQLAPGTSGQLLQSNGSAAPSWVTPSGGGVTSINGQTGAVVNTAAYDIGSFVTGRPANATGYAVGATIAGTSLYSMATGVFWHDAGSWYWSSPYSAPISSGGTAVLINTGSWRCVSAAGSTTDGTNSYGMCGLWVRYA